MSDNKLQFHHLSTYEIYNHCEVIYIEALLFPQTWNGCHQKETHLTHSDLYNMAISQ